tara:strand:+ start:3410 stop:3688 length:279 start_codon:yes stop_codon:yes gene_type:complete
LRGDVSDEIVGVGLERAGRGHDLEIEIGSRFAKWIMAVRHAGYSHRRLENASCRHAQRFADAFPNKLIKSRSGHAFLKMVEQGNAGVRILKL